MAARGAGGGGRADGARPEKGKEGEAYPGEATRGPAGGEGLPAPDDQRREPPGGGEEPERRLPGERPEDEEPVRR